MAGSEGMEVGADLVACEATEATPETARLNRRSTGRSHTCTEYGKAGRGRAGRKLATFGAHFEITLGTSCVPHDSL